MSGCLTFGDGRIENVANILSGNSFGVEGQNKQIGSVVDINFSKFRKHERAQACTSASTQ